MALDPLSSSLSKATNDTASAYLPSSAASTKVPLLQEAQLVACRPLVTAIIVVLLLGTACAGLASLRIDNNPTDNVRATRAAWWASD